MSYVVTISRFALGDRTISATSTDAASDADGQRIREIITAALARMDRGDLKKAARADPGRVRKRKNRKRTRGA